MLKIRLQRTGKRGQAYFKVVVTEHTVKPQGKYLELLGSYDPHKNKMTVDGEKVKHWISQGAHLSETANNLLISRGIIEGDKVQTWKAKSRRKEVGTPTETSEKKKGGLPAQAGETTAQAQTPIEVKVEAQTEAKEETKEEVRVEEPAPAPTETSVEAPATS
mgnify:FL=1